MDPFTLGFAAIGAITSGLGLFGQSKDQSAQRAAQAAALQEQQKVIGFQKEENDQRKQAMELDATRRRREMVRQSIVARSTALSTVVAQGGGASNTSALPGAYAGISGRTNVNELGVNQDEQIGENIFGLNNKISDAQGSAAAYTTQANSYAGKAAQNGAMISLGTTLMTNATTIGKIGGSIGGLFQGFGGGTPTSTSNPATPGSLY